jgi:hypothetical protein
VTVKTALLTLALALPLAVRAADVPTSYTVNDTALKAAIAGTSLTFTLYSDAGCTQQVHQQAVPIETVNLVSRLKVFTAKSAPTKSPKTAELRETLTGVSAAGNLYLKVTGTGITPVGGACQAQTTSLGGTTTGQTGSTVFGSGPLTSPGAFTQVPNLALTLNVPASSLLYVSTDGGVLATGGLAVIDVALYVDGVQTNLLRRTQCGTDPLDVYCDWSMATTMTLSAGIHTLSVRAVQSSGAGTATVGGATGSGTQGQLTALIIKQ